MSIGNPKTDLLSPPNSQKTKSPSKFPKNKKESKMVTTVLAIIYIALALTTIPAVIESVKKQEDTMTGFMSALFFVFSATAYTDCIWI